MAAIKLKQSPAFQIQTESPNQRKYAVLSCGCYVLFGSLCFGWGPDQTPNFSEEDRTVESLRRVTGEKLQIKIIGLI